MKNISFIILNYNDFETTIKLVDKIYLWDKSEFLYNIVIVDNYSTDASYSKLCNKYGSCNNIEVLKSNKNGGYAYGNNIGAFYAIEQYAPDFIAICNPDISFEQDVIVKLLNTFEISEKIAMVAPEMKNQNNGEIRYGTDIIPNYKDDLKDCFASIYPKLFKVKPKQNRQYKNYENLLVTQMLPGSFFIIRTNVFKEIDGFDEGMFLFCEERIIGRKLLDKGYISIVRLDTIFTHEHGRTIKKNIDIINIQKDIYKSRLYYEKKYNNINIIKIVILKICMTLSIFLLKALQKIKVK